MKIIYRGKLPEEKVYEGKCHHCKTEVEYQQHEGTLSPDQRDNGATFVACPVCYRHIWGRERPSRG